MLLIFSNMENRLERRQQRKQRAQLGGYNNVWGWGVVRQAGRSRQNLVVFWRQNQQEEEGKLHLLRRGKLKENWVWEIKSLATLKTPRKPQKDIQLFQLLRAEKKHLKLEFEFCFSMKVLLDFFHTHQKEYGQKRSQLSKNCIKRIQLLICLGSCVCQVF